MMAADLASTLAALTPLALAVGYAVVRFGAPLKRLDLELLYLHIVAAFACVVALLGATGIVIFGSMLWSQAGAPDERFWRGQLAMDIALALVALPAWLWHYFRARRLSRERNGATMHRAYLYLVALIGLVGAVTSAGSLVAEVARVVIGLVDLGSAPALRQFQAWVVTWGINAAVFAGVWWAHLRSVRIWSV